MSYKSLNAAIAAWEEPSDTLVSEFTGRTGFVARVYRSEESPTRAPTYRVNRYFDVDGNWHVSVDTENTDVEDAMSVYGNATALVA